ncbi:hypothetical protein Q31a_36500 [Aureliella helgolandensis]|uniref:Uncharacterized protein n=1 Tax=Aureliella helgolandensis TaxID=2527968 RepID=A0A518G9R0_9BACT|nr:hypothetical protein Q31a_36500 [Aureliella helgolandensis]
MTNPKRVAAGRRNRALRGPLTDAGRQSLSDAIQACEPWKHSTGPKTTKGKETVSRNACRTRLPLVVFGAEILARSRIVKAHFQL